MSVYYWRKILQGAMISSIPAMMAITTTAKQAKVPELVLNGCCAGFKSTYRGSVNLELPENLTKPIPYNECIAMCRATLGLPKVPAPNENSRFKIDKCVEHKANKRTVMRCDYVESVGCVAGRLPAGLQAHEVVEYQDDLGRYFSEVAFLEEAAVQAFEWLAMELESLKAPDEFVQRARQAADEEREHTQMTRLLAKMYNAPVPTVEVMPFTMRSLSEIAIENAVEGCVRETYASLMAQWQSLRASSPEVRAVMSRIADEETGHAALSWAIDEWITPKLGPEEREQKDKAQRDMVDTLFAHHQKDPSLAMMEVAGFPSAAQSQVLLQNLKAQVWQA